MIKQLKYVSNSTSGSEEKRLVNLNLWQKHTSLKYEFTFVFEIYPERKFALYIFIFAPLDLNLKLLLKIIIYQESWWFPFPIFLWVDLW